MFLLFVDNVSCQPSECGFPFSFIKLIMSRWYFIYIKFTFLLLKAKNLSTILVIIVVVFLADTFYVLL